MAPLPPPTICVLHPGKSHYSRSYICDHIERLQAKEIDTSSIRPPHLIARLESFFARRILRIPSERWACRSVKKLLLKNRVDVVLAEFGSTAALFLGADSKAFKQRPAAQ